MLGVRARKTIDPAIVLDYHRSRGGGKIAWIRSGFSFVAFLHYQLSYERMVACKKRCLHYNNEKNKRKDGVLISTRGWLNSGASTLSRLAAATGRVRRPAATPARSAESPTPSAIAATATAASHRPGQGPSALLRWRGKAHDGVSRTHAW